MRPPSSPHVSGPVSSLRSASARVDPYLWLVLAFSALAVVPLAGPEYFFNAHDAPNTVFFLTEFDAALRDGVWYPGWATDQALGYGYPTFVLYPPLAYYMAEGFHLLGAGKVVAVKWTWALATVGAGLAMYACGRHLLGRPRGLLAAVVYVYVPYHLADIYVRAALAEYCAFAWMPLVLLAFHRLVEPLPASGRACATRRRLAWAGLAYGALFLTHNVTALAFTPLVGLYLLFRLWMASRERVPTQPPLLGAAAALAAGLLGLGIAAALLLPNLLERGFINQEQWVRAGYDYALHFLEPSHFLSAAWGYLPGVPGVEGGMSFQLGAVPLILSMAALVRALLASRPCATNTASQSSSGASGTLSPPGALPSSITLTRETTPARPVLSDLVGQDLHLIPWERALVLFLAAATLLLVFFMTPLSASLWHILPLAGLIQFPWRLLALTSLTLSLLAGLAFTDPATRGESNPVLAASVGRLPAPFGFAHRSTILLVALVALLASYSYTVPQYTPVPASAEGPLLSIEFELKYTDMRGMTAWTQEMPPDSPLVAQYLAGGPLVTARALAPGASVEMIRAGGASDEMWVRSPTGTPLRFFTYYFPGWRVYVDGRRLPESALRPETVYGLLTVDIPSGERRVLLRWGDTPVRAVGKAVTLASLALAFTLLLLPPLRRGYR